MIKLIMGMILLSATAVVNATEHDRMTRYCSAHADMTSTVFELRKVEGVSLSSFISQVEGSGKKLNSNTRYFFTYAYNLPIKYSKKQVFDSAYALCSSTYDSLVAKK
ncbi:hypothetical protein A9Q79_04630 [Methylophaga sp. 42_25_T18]|nr:hypothetical protein A9Q79_04630 [Methylophaga sp. 42_25_T18]OUR86815.1 hypothetical protein A9Q92_05210 [Methylophaga sp. 42_8_T64]